MKLYTLSKERSKTIPCPLEHPRICNIREYTRPVRNILKSLLLHVVTKKAKISQLEEIEKCVVELPKTWDLT